MFYTKPALITFFFSDSSDTGKGGRLYNGGQCIICGCIDSNITGVRSLAGILCGNEGLHVSLPSLHLADSTVFLYNVNNTDYILNIMPKGNYYVR